MARHRGFNQPASTIAATGHVDLVEATEYYEILFRMLEPHELAAAMGFDSQESDLRVRRHQDREDQADR